MGGLSPDVLRRDGRFSEGFRMTDNSLNQHHLFVFGRFRLDAAERLLFRGTELVPLEPKVFETLLTLVEASGRALTKDELLSRVWPDAFVEEGSLTRNISTLRKVLASDENPQGYIETLSRRGYRFQPVVERVSVTPVTPAASIVPAASAPTPAPRPAPAFIEAERPVSAPRFRWPTIAGVTAAALLVVVAAAAWWRPGGQVAPITSIAVLPLQNLSADPS